MAERWVADGHDVTVFTSQPSYNDVHGIPAQPKSETINGVRVIRLNLFREEKKNYALRLLNSLLFIFSAGFHAICCHKYDLITTATMPPVLMGMTARLISKIRGVPYLYHYQDIYPEVGILSGFFKENWFYRLLQKIDSANCVEAKAVVVLSKDMANTLMRRGLPGNNFHIINNFIMEAVGKVEKIPQALIKPSGSFRILFGGNIGNFQGLEHVLDAAWRLKDYPEIHFLFLGEGAAKKKLQEMAGDMLNKTVFFAAYQPMNIAFQVMQEADLGLVTLKPDIYKVAYPSKTMMYLAAGCYLLVMIEPESELASFVVKNNIGSSCIQGDSEGMAEIILKQYNNRRVIFKKRQDIKQIGEKFFGREVALNRWSDLIKELSRDQKIR